MLNSAGTFSADALLSFPLSAPAGFPVPPPYAFSVEGDGKIVVAAADVFSLCPALLSACPEPDRPPLLHPAAKFSSTAHNAIVSQFIFFIKIHPPVLEYFKLLHNQIYLSKLIYCQPDAY